jgi:hypothetical protein
MLLSSTVCIVSFVSKLKFQSSKENEKRRTVWCTQNQANGRLKIVQSNAQAPSTTPVYNQATIAIFFTSTYSQPTPRSNKRSGSHHTNEFRATGKRNEKRSLLLQQRRVEVSHLWPPVGTVIGLEASVKTQFSFNAAKFVVSQYCRVVGDVYKTTEKRIWSPVWSPEITRQESMHVRGIRKVTLSLGLLSLPIPSFSGIRKVRKFY